MNSRLNTFNKAVKNYIISSIIIFMNNFSHNHICTL